MFALEICHLPRITEFAFKLRINSQSLSQSESSNFSQCVIMVVSTFFLQKKKSMAGIEKQEEEKQDFDRDSFSNLVNIYPFMLNSL